MASLNITLKDKAVVGNEFTGTVEVSGEDFLGNEFRHEKVVRIVARTDFDIDVGPCKVHLTVWLASPTQACVDGHLQCGPARQPTNGPFCLEL